MESSGGPSRPVIRGVKRDAENEEQRAKKLKKAEKMIEEKDLRIQELEQKLESLERKCQHEQQLSKRMMESENAISSRKSTEEKEIEALLVKSAETWKEKSGESFLHVAARTGNLKAVKYYLSIEGLRVDINAKNRNGYTPILEAAEGKRNFAEIANLLVAHGADLSVANRHGESTLYIALTTGIPVKEIEKVFGPLTSGICSLSDKNEENVLHKAAEQGDLEALEYYMSLKPDPVDVNAKDVSGWTPLMKTLFARENLLPILDLLLKNGAKFGKDSPGNGMITAALRFKRPLAYIEKLVDFGAPWDKNSVLFSCIEFGNDEALKYFIRKGANVNAITPEGLKPLLVAPFKGKFEKDFRGKGIISAALRFKRPWTDIEKLVDAGAPWDKNSIVFDCIASGDLETLKYFIRKGADVNAETTEGLTPMLMATALRRSDILDILTANGAKPLQSRQMAYSAFLSIKPLLGKDMVFSVVSVDPEHHYVKL